MTKLLGVIFGVILVNYFMLYPVIYFAWNWGIVVVGFPQFAIPGFWIGMVGFFLFNMVKGLLK